MRQEKENWRTMEECEKTIRGVGAILDLCAMAPETMGGFRGAEDMYALLADLLSEASEALSKATHLIRGE